MLQNIARFRYIATVLKLRLKREKSKHCLDKMQIQRVETRSIEHRSNQTLKRFGKIYLGAVED